MDRILFTRHWPAARLFIAFLCMASIAACGGAEERLARALENGEQFLQERNYDKARIEFSNALQIDPNNADAIYMAGRAAEGLQDYRAAVSAYRAALDVDANHLNANAAMGRMLLFSGQAELALEQVEPVLVIAPDDADLLTVRAAANAALENTEQAKTDAEAVVAAHPGHEQAVALLAGMYRSDGDSARAIGVTQTALQLNPDSVDLRSILSQLHQSDGDLDAAEAELQAIIDLRPDELVHRNRLAQFYLTTNRAADAEAILRENIAREPDSIEHKITLVNYLRAQQSYDAAEQQLRTFVAAAPEDAALKYALGQFLEANTYTEDAETIYREVIAEAGVTLPALDARNRLSARMLRTGRAELAEPLIGEVLAANPRDPDALTMRASIALSNGDPDTAITDLRSVLRDQPTNATVLSNLARAHVRNGEPDLALQNYRLATTADPGNNETRLEYAQFLRERGNLVEAERLLQASLDVNETDLASLESMFSVQLGQGNAIGAAATADEAIAAYPEHPLGYYLKGQLLQAQRDIDGAKAQYELSLEKEPRGAEPLTALVRIEVATGQLEAARARLTQLTVDHPDHAVAYNLLAGIYTSEQNYTAASENLDAAINIAPAWWVPHRAKAVLLRDQGNLDSARQVFAHGLEQTSGAPGIGMDYAALLEAIGEPEEALKVYARMYANNPASDVIANNYAMLLTTHRNDTASFERAFDMVRGFRTSDEPAFLDTYGWVRLKQGSVDEAVSYLRRAAEAVPRNAAIRYHYAQSLFESGDMAAALAEVAAALELGQQFAELDDARALMGQIDPQR